MEETTRRIRFSRPKGNTFHEMAENVRKSKLYELGDAVLVWVNEGDFWISGAIDADANPSPSKDNMT